METGVKEVLTALEVEFGTQHLTSVYAQLDNFGTDLSV